ncbi:MAG: IPTL-CTERM sorting domain-containing protein [Acidimicrobiia bacterium]|nr:IPTL-CTERM sorting domain-containing protein [Acidimicrobiia bacterium]
MSIFKGAGARIVAAAGGVFALVVLAAGPAAAATVTIPAQGGNHQVTVSAGATVVAGYDFTYNQGSTVEVLNGKASLDVTCASTNQYAGTVTVTMPNQTYDGSQNSQGWEPSGDQGDPSTYQGSLTMPNLCSGGQMVIGKPNMGPFTADVYSNTQQQLNFRWHYGLPSDEKPNGNGTSWSATKSVTPDALSGVSQVAGLGHWGVVVLAGAFLAAGVWVFRRTARAGAVA